MDFEEYWQQTRRKWEDYMADPCIPFECGFCRFTADLGKSCGFCPAFRVYGTNCEEVVPVRAYYDGWSDRDTDVEDLSLLAKAVVKELDDKKDELIAAMQDLREEANDDNQDQ